MTPSGLSVEVSHGALVAGARSADRERAVFDLRRDAWGHGLGTALDALVAAGARHAVADPADTPRVQAAGIAVAAVADGASAAVYGLPSSPAMRAVSVVLSTKRLRAGEGVSYGYTHRATTDTWIGLVAGGYGQGVARALGNRVAIAVDGRMCPVVGRIAMDVCVVDLGADGARTLPGTPVTLFGGEGPARGNLLAWTEATGWSAAELAGVIGASVPRRTVA
ncbi:alanine racemase C-terminal domain-containing protein [Microbacterium sp. SSW1-59]|uniref:alanine racemase C-terminal domain-containing protein n=1 Tax=Microbacterium xanthum TaxID=3079794 RepID=UPI002AD369E1|nr:alanine racemase C-terminal domain-containing protein [Microbacterium sp. SSW1-59]MDZ8201806.1 alanine racemase C-terminal domain-containing protein [Microbacterium sp. SSW1-59]